MKKIKPLSWQSIRDEVFRRISQREWLPGEPIPNETELAVEFGCARATVNRALRELANEGLLDRKRKGGSKVSLHAVRKATLDIPVTRQEIEQRGAVYRHVLLEHQVRAPTAEIRGKMPENKALDLLFLRSLHLADEAPFLYEERWINTALVPEALALDLNAISANEWLVNNAVFSRMDLKMFAANATARQAEHLQTPKETALLMMERTTWQGDEFVTSVKLSYAPGYILEASM